MANQERNRFAAVKLSAIILLSVTILDSVKGNDECGLSKHISKRIVGGERVAIEKFPWMVELRPRISFISCGGAIISRHFVLTAAHCFKWTPEIDIIITLGTDQYHFTEAVIRKAQQVIRYPSYNISDTHDDLMLLKMNDSIVYNEDIQPICLPSASLHYAGEMAVVLGFGVKSYHGEYSQTLRAVEVKILPHDECQQSFSPVKILPTQLCAGGEEGKDACQGDSGSPLILYQNGRYSIVGVVSWGRQCATKGIPGVYTRVSSYLEWIKNVTNL